jgi:HK97 family phage major capsid protein
LGLQPAQHPIAILAPALELRDDRVTGLAIRFGSPAERDREGQYFDAQTNLYLDSYIPGAPVWLSHNIDYARSTPDYAVVWEDPSPIGHMLSYQVTPQGVWVTVQLTLDHEDPRYGPLVEMLLAGEGAYSSDSVRHIVAPRIEEDGHIAEWPVAGLSIVHRSFAAEPRQPPLTAKALFSALKAAFPAPAQSAPGGVLYLAQQRCAEQDRAQRAPACTPPLDQSVKPTRSFEAMKTLSKEQRTQLDALVADAAKALGVKPDVSVLLGALKAVDPAQMDEATAAQVNDLLGRLAALLGLEDGADIGQLIAALQALGSPEAAPPEEADKADPPQVDAAAIADAVFRRLEPKLGELAAKGTAEPPATPQAPPAAPAQDGDAAKAAGFPVGEIIAETAKATTEALLKQGLTAPATGVMPPGSMTGAFAHAPAGQPAAKAVAGWNLRKPGGKMTYAKAVSAVLDGPDAAKAIGLTQGESGGFLVPQEQSQEFIELLEDEMILSALGADFIPMTAQSMIVPKMLDGATAYYVADNAEITESEPQFGQVTLNLRRIAVLVPISNAWIKRAGWNGENRIRDNMKGAVRRRMELDCMRGTGKAPSSQDSGSAPLGVRFIDGVGKINLDGAIPTLETLQAMVLTLQQNNVADDGTYGWAMNPRTLSIFTNMRNAIGEPVFRTSWADGAKQTLLGYPVRVTNALPLNLNSKGVPSASGAYTELYFGRWSDLVVGVGTDVEIATSTERYFEKDMTLIRAIMDFDGVVFHGESFVVAYNASTASAES